MTEIIDISPFHRGEQAVQERAGIRRQIEKFGRKVIRDHLPEQHREFYAGLPFLLIGAVDDAGRPWASALYGRPGFISSPDEKNLTINSLPRPGDPLAGALRAGLPLGILGMDPATRRRNRLSATVASADNSGLQVAVRQAFGNCPQYIQARQFEFLPAIDTPPTDSDAQNFTSLGEAEQDIIRTADTFFIATHYADDDSAQNQGADVSHRGGKPGFVRIDNEGHFSFPDFAGNSHYNTLGNLQMNPKAGFLFMDFDSGDLLYLTGSVEVIWEGEELQAFQGAKRMLRFSLEQGTRLPAALPIRWELQDYSPSLGATGSWDEVAAAVA